MNIPYLDLMTINKPVREGLISRFKNVLDNGRYIQAQWCEKFEKKFADFVGVKHAFGVGNGLDALRIILQAAGLGDGDEVIVPANTFIATILAIKQAGCVPILVDIDPQTQNLSPKKAEAAISPMTKAIMAVHLYGRMAPMRELLELAEHYGLSLFEDAAQAHGAKLEGRFSGNWSHAAGFSFYPGKNLGAFGDGGMITTNDSEFYEKARKIANYGSSEKYVHEYAGCNSRLDEVQAAFLDLKLETLEADNLRRRAIAEYFMENIRNPMIKMLPKPESAESNVWHIFPVFVREREKFRAYLAYKGIGTMVHYPIPPHKQKALPELWHMELPLTEAACKQEVSLPCNQSMFDEQVEHVVEACNDWR